MENKRCPGCKTGPPTYCPCTVKEGYYPPFGMGSIVLDENISNLSCKPKVSFFPGNDKDVTRSFYLLFNASKDSIMNLGKEVDGPYRYIFSAFFENLDYIDGADYEEHLIDRKKASTEKITVTCKKNPKTGQTKITTKDDPNGEPYTFSPNVLPVIIMDPFTAALINNTSITWCGSKDSDYRIGCVLVEEIESVVNTVEIQALRRKAIREANNVINRAVQKGETKT